MKLGTIVICFNFANNVLIGRKRNSELGNDTLNFPGGKIEGMESFRDCAKREFEEETGLTPQGDLKLLAEVIFCIGDKPDFLARVFELRDFSGQTKETDTMYDFHWYKIDELPYRDMLDADRFIFPIIFQKKENEYLKIKVFYQKRASGFEKIEIEVKKINQ